MSEDREDSRQQFEEGESPLLKRILFVRSVRGYLRDGHRVWRPLRDFFLIDTGGHTEHSCGRLCFRGDHRGCAALGGSGGAVQVVLYVRYSRRCSSDDHMDDRAARYLPSRRGWCQCPTRRSLLPGRFSIRLSFLEAPSRRSSMYHRSAQQGE